MSNDNANAKPWQRANTDWMHNATWGVLCHYLPSDAPGNDTYRRGHRVDGGVGSGDKLKA